MAELNWDKLLSTERFRESKKDAVDHRSEFERDFDRVIFSSSFRRLQDKTQVWPLEAHDFIRTRLTHSCEAATIGRSLAKGVFGELRDTLPHFDPNAGAAIVSTACLLHDIGNPPFGHTGEDHIATWFKRLFEAHGTLEMGEQEKLDLAEFEGNAHTLRVAARLQTLGKPRGMNLTFGTLSALIKYPWSSSETTPKAGRKRKFGYFKSESDVFHRVREATGLPDKVRHPLAHLVEAADDIAYSIVDVEDGLKKGAFSYAEFVEEAKKVDSQVGGFIETHLVRHLAELTDLNCAGSPAELQQLAFQQFRVFTIGKMTGSVVRVFTKNYKSIMRGEVQGDLVERGDLAPLIKFLKDFATKRVYTAPEVVKTERAAKQVIGGLLNILWEEAQSKKSKLLDVLVKNVDADGEVDCSSDYRRCQRLTDYIAGMTDTYAFSLYSRLSGGRLW